jgi:multiple sugar transport system permease protein
VAPIGRTRSATGWIATSLLAVAFAVPLIVMVVGSLRRPGQPPRRRLDVVPQEFSVESYRRAFDLVDLSRQLVNSLVASALAAAIAVVTSSLAGLAIARTERRVSNTLTGLAVVGLVVPPSAVVVGRLVIYRQLGVVDTLVPLVAPALYGVTSFAVLMFAFAFRRVPSELFEVAEVEGLGPLDVWGRVALPAARSMVIAVAMLVFAVTWGDFLTPLTAITSESRFTLPLGLRQLQYVGRQDVPVLLAACAVATAPVVVLFALLQRFLFDAFSRTA